MSQRLSHLPAHIRPTPSPDRGSDWCLEPPEAFQGWCHIAHRNRVSGMQIDDVKELLRVSGDRETCVLYLVEALARDTFQCVFGRHFSDTSLDNALDVWCRARILQQFGADMLRDVEAEHAAMKLPRLPRDRADSAGVNFYDVMRVRSSFESVPPPTDPTATREAVKP